ncbi:MAG TPA: sigma-70 family RNA polymerase sigma factor, partial [Verrucomicrobiales bacterium]|nr:sigma-70 family RNA polymerase sigma factor [Verrucomicrobiales bacterium]
MFKNMGDTDLQLLNQYIRHHAEDSFTELVRHFDLVYFAAFRQVRAPHLAEEVAQAVFTDLARSAQGLRSKTVITAWLYQVTRRKAIDVVRRESRRQVREQIAFEMNAMSAPDTQWTKIIEPLLDEAMQMLDETDRSAILLRFCENKSLREVDQTLGTSEGVAQKRVSRAVDHLRRFFGKRGFPIKAGGLISAISSHAVGAAPAGLVVTISKAALVAGTTVTTTGAIINTIVMTTFKKSIIVTTLVTLVGTGVFETHKVSGLRKQIQTLEEQDAGQARELRRERGEVLSRLAATRNEMDRLRRDLAELPDLRGEISRLQHNLKEQTHAKPQSVDATEIAAKFWVDRVSVLKEHLEQTPAAWIPELQFLTDEDWLNAAKKELNTDEDMRRAMGNLRATGEGKFAPKIQNALEGYLQNNDGEFPSPLTLLKPYFDSPIDEAIILLRIKFSDLNLGILHKLDAGQN